jgi:peroxiredoxin (alkyl hydroperoxide reductase subunit C)
MAEAIDGCVKPTKGPIGVEIPQSNVGSQTAVKEAPKMLARVGKPAPDFELSAYLDGGFKNIKLSDYKGKWIVVCFYPGDFTFV